MALLQQIYRNFVFIILFEYETINGPNCVSRVHIGTWTYVRTHCAINGQGREHRPGNSVGAVYLETAVRENKKRANISMLLK
jgi:hypothetical protein